MEPEKLKGVMKKRGEKNRGYKSRFFTQRALVLEYYASEAKSASLGERKGVIALEDVERVLEAQGELQVEMKRGTRVFHLRPDARDLEYWREGLRAWVEHIRIAALRDQVQVQLPPPQQQQQQRKPLQETPPQAEEPPALQMSYAAPVAEALVDEEVRQLRHTVKKQQQTIEQLRRQMRAQAAALDGPPEAFDVWQAIKGGDVRGASSGTTSLAKLRLANTSPLHVACELGNSDLVRLLLRESSLLDEHDDTGKTPLLISIEYEFFEITQLLLKVCDASLASKQGVSPLHAAVINQDAKVVTLLLKHHANVDAQDERLGWTALMFAASLGDTTIAKILLKAGADKKARSARGDTAHVIASQEGHMKLAGLLQ